MFGLFGNTSHNAQNKVLKELILAWFSAVTPRPLDLSSCCSSYRTCSLCWHYTWLSNTKNGEIGWGNWLWNAWKTLNSVWSIAPPYGTIPIGTFWYIQCLCTRLYQEDVSQILSITSKQHIKETKRLLNYWFFNNKNYSRFQNFKFFARYRLSVQVYSLYF